jgi:Xaa-Pro aminopeptidase
MLNNTHGETSVAVFFSGKEKLRNGDNYYPFRSSSDFFYLTGFPEPNAWLIITCSEKNSFSDTLFCLPKDPLQELWNGPRIGPKEAVNRFLFQNSQTIENLQEEIEKSFCSVKNLFFPFAESDEIDTLIKNSFIAIKKQGRGKKASPQKIIDASQTIANFRLIKDTEEINSMRKAALISSNAHIRAMKFCKPGITEYQLEAELLHEFGKSGSQSVAYPSIVASGPNSCILHHKAGQRVLKENEILLIDAGCEIDGYASDITRSFPVSGYFSSPQREVYEIVLAAQKAAIKSTKPNADFSDPHEAAVKVISQGIIDIGLIKNISLNEVIDKELYKQFYMHRTGHWLGMDVHDVGDYSKPLQPGMVLTIEPGCYIRPSNEIDEHFWNIGIRIEDDALVTDTGCELISRKTPVEVEEIESLINQ